MCTSPLWRFPISEAQLTWHKINTKGLPYRNGAFVFSKNRFDIINYLSGMLGGDISALQEIPCGQCLECRLANSREMAQRSCHEASYYSDNWFITLTYDDAKLTQGDLIYSINPVTLQYGEWININMHEVSSFMKRLRSRIEYSTGHTGVRAVYCSEYGPLHGRAHYHINLFNCPIPDLKILRKNYCDGKNWLYYSSDIIEKCWGKGNIVIAPFSYETAAYVSRYILKKQRGKSWESYLEACRIAGVPPMNNEGVQYPTRPGLARQYYEDHKEDIYKFDAVILPNGHQAKPARYYDALFDIEDHEQLEKIKARRKRINELVRFNKLKAAKVQNADDLIKARSYYLRQRLERLPRRDL